ncbi:MAG: class I SAM-dependent methyltransferase [Deltaproteobacteria bacterium]|nr:class I SAM-dependent methyltransferase [Deltaproteobacteria bacterium]MBW2415148.1 class I SAM-dependent methyltransferase [Deltaproteobacteria bacterium]
MSSLALMRWLESAPDRYDAGMRLLTLGRLSRVHRAAAEAACAEPGARVLEIGCGTGALTERLVRAGARVTALDHSAEMLERARTRLGERAAGVEWLERSASEIDALPDASYDVAVASLCLSDMGASERAFVLRALAAVVRPGGAVVIADEVVPNGGLRRAVHALVRVPQAALGWLLAGAVSSPLRDPAAELRQAGLRVQSERRWLGGTLALVVAEVPA